MPVLCPKCSQQVGEIVPAERGHRFKPWVGEDRCRAQHNPDDPDDKQVIGFEMTCSCGHEWSWKVR